MNETQELAVIPQHGNGYAVTQALGVNEIVAQVRLIQDVMGKVMKEGEHYGTIPGCGDKKTLLQPGAQKLTMTFRLAPEYQIQESQLPNGHKEYRIICTLKSIQSGSFVGQGVGVCSTMESKYRWRGGARKCPHCGKESIIKGKAEFGGGWLCFAKKGGCGAKWNDGASEIESQSVDKVETDSPADSFNTVLKMAKKRAFVDATITATAASDIFTQDILDDETNVSDEPSKGRSASPEPAQTRFEDCQPTLPKQTPKPAPAQPQTQRGGVWRNVIVPKFIKKYSGMTLGEMADKDLLWWAQNYTPKPFKGEITQADTDFRAALDAGMADLQANQSDLGEDSPPF